MTGTAIVLIPPLVIIMLVLLTRRVIPSLGVGIILSSLIFENFHFGDTIKRIGKTILHLFYEDGEVATGNLNVLGFLLLLGVMTGMIHLLGGGRAFGEFASKKLHSKRQVTMGTALFGMTMFPDDVFNMFTNGQVSRPLFDRFGISREKLAYMIHSTSDPLCVLTPISSWGAYITSIFAAIFVMHDMDANPIVTFVEVGFLNFYALTTIALVFLVAYFDLRFWKMRKAESHVKPYDSNDSHRKGSIWSLFIPIIVLMISSIGLLIWTSYRNSDTKSIVDWFANGEVSYSLLMGALAACLVTFVFTIRTKQVKLVPQALINGMKTTLPAVWILLFAWMQSELTGLLKTGEYLGGIIEQTSLSSSWLPFLLFILTGIMAFSTGTSWGTFAIMLPISAQIGLVTGVDITPLFAAVLSGSLFGDHCSPISDTTTVAASAAGCNHMNHVLTQIPYALTAASITAGAFLFYGLTGISWISYLFILLMLTGITVIYRRKEAKQTV
ncbi:Na+/H+ antiporter NhaC family protein [Gracilibacillus sp. Marseille-QA3620]